MGVYLRSNFEVSRIILTSLRQGEVIFPPAKPQNEPVKSTPRLELSSLKSKVNKLDIDKLVPASIDLNTLNDVVKNYVVKKEAYNGKIKNIEDKIPDITNLATNVYAKIDRLKVKYLVLLTQKFNTNLNLIRKTLILMY